MILSKVLFNKDLSFIVKNTILLSCKKNLLNSN